MDGAMTKSPLGGGKTGANPTDRGKRGVKRSLLTEAQGVPVGLAVDGGEPPRHEAGASHGGQPAGATTGAQPRASPGYVPGQGLRLR